MIETLRDAQRLGFFGPGDLAPAISQACDFAALVPPGSRSIVDIGSGGGLPGLVVAVLHPEAQVTFVERRATRADHLRRVVRRLGLGVTVLNVDVSQIHTLSGEPLTFDVVTARGFAEAATTWRLVRPILNNPGCLIVSDSRADQGVRWQPLGGVVVERRDTVSLVVPRETSD